MGEAARKPTSKPISVSLCLRTLRVNRPEATRCTRAASARGAVWWFHASVRLTRSARRHEGTEDLKNWAAHISATFRLISLCWTRLGGVRNGRDALVASDGGADADGVRPRQARPSRVLDLYDNPIISRPLSIRSFPVPLQWMKQRVSQPQNQSPCPRDSARSVLTGRRPRDVPAPPRHVALGGSPEPPVGQHGARGDTKARRISRIGLHTSL